MKRKVLPVVVSGAHLFFALPVFGQAFGEYGRAVGGLPQGVGPRGSGGVSHGGSADIGITNSKALPKCLVVSVKETGLYPKQDVESETLVQLQLGEPLVPMVQSTGGNDWYMVKTQKGLIGWVQRVNVQEESVKN